MIKKVILTSVCTVLSFSAFAETPMDMMASLTEDQRACVETHGCVVPEQPETTAALAAFMDCMKNAKISCGIEKPEMPMPEAGQSEPDMPVPAPDMPPASDMPMPETEQPAPDMPAPEVITEQESEPAIQE